jgi:type II restriction/modification system DNA methylase subunit YeeA
MAKLHDKLLKIGYTDHNLEVYLVRLLFCLFADKTGIFEKNIFLDFIIKQTSADGSDLSSRLAHLFQVLDTPEEERLETLNEFLNFFPYVNGKLFEENLRIPAFNRDMMKILLKVCRLDWSKISPAIFGSLFQSVLDKEERRIKGVHFTSGKNILKLINPLFMDNLWDEFEKIKKLKEPNNSRKLNANLYHFGILNSGIHMIWVKYACGRLKGDFTYSATIVYNSFPWSENPS